MPAPVLVPPWALQSLVRLRRLTEWVLALALALKGLAQVLQVALDLQAQARGRTLALAQALQQPALVLQTRAWAPKVLPQAQTS